MHDRDALPCADCGDPVPRDHTVYVSGSGRICWFCYSSLDDADADEPEAWDDDDDDFDDDDDEQAEDFDVDDD